MKKSLILTLPTIFFLISCSKDAIKENKTSTKTDPPSVIYVREDLNKNTMNIYTNDITGTNEKPVLLDYSSRLLYPNWSVNDQVYFLSNYQDRGYSQIYSVNVNGGSVIKISNCSTCAHTDFAISDKSNRIAYRKIYDNSTRGRQVIATCNFDGTDEKEILTLTDINAGTFISWTPDGSQIIYVDVANLNERPVQNIYLINSDGSGKKQITQNTSDLMIFNSPYVSPDGKRIIYMKYDYSYGGKYCVYISNIDGSNEQTVLTSSPDLFLGLISNWSKDGKYILITGEQINGLYLFNTEDKSLKQITSTKCITASFKD